MNDHEKFMCLAVNQAKLALEAGEVPVGCIIVHKDSKKILATGYNKTNETQNPTKHCEFIAIENLQKVHSLDILKESILYVTVEPCIMCAKALRQIQIYQVYFGCNNLRFGGCGSIYQLNKSTFSSEKTTTKSKFIKDDDEQVTTTIHDSYGDDGTYTYQVKGGIKADIAIQLLRDFYARGNPNCPAYKRHRPLITTNPNESLH